MQKKVNALLLISTLSICLQFALLPSFALARENQFYNINLDKGLSQVSACTMAVDSYGRIWIGTRNGLDCWDGERMRSYTYAQRDNSTIIDPVISSIVINEDALWALSKSGLSKMDLNTQRIKRYYISECSDITVCDGDVYISKGKNIFRYSETHDAIELFSSQFVGKNNILSLSSTSDSMLLIGCSDGEVYEWNGLDYSLLYSGGSRTHSVKTIFKDSFSRLWIGCQDGLFRLGENGAVTEFNSVHSDVRDIVEDVNNNIWVATFNGVYRVEPDDTITHLVADDNDEFSIPNNSVYSLMIDRNETLWLGTYFGGVSYKHIGGEEFNIFRRGDDSGLTSNITGHIIEADNDNLWIATEGGGLNYFNMSTNKFITSRVNSNIPQNCNIRYLYKVDNDRIMMSIRHYGLKMYNYRRGDVKDLMPSVPHPEHIVKLDSLYVVSSIGNGLQLLDVGSGKSRPFPEKKSYREKIGSDIIPILYDNHGILWIGTLTKGLFAYDVKQDKLKQYTYNEHDEKSISAGQVCILTMDSSNSLWLATEGGGVSKYNPKTDDFTNYNTTNSKLPSDIIHSIVESRFGNLWISTAKGLVRFDVPNKIFYTYSAEGGFPLRELNYNSLYVTAEGVLFAGGVDGMTYFDESILINSPVYNRPILSDLYVNNSRFSVDDYPDISKKDIVVAKEIKLRHQYREFGIRFSDCNYGALKSKYQYMLEGVDDDWVDAEYRAEAVYANLPSGNYRFRVRATDTSYMIHSAERVLDIKILPPLYLAWYSILVYVIIIFTVVYIVMRFYIRDKLLTQKVSMAKAEKERAEEHSDAKSRFFTSISNELLTPLTIVISSIDEMFSSQFIPAEIKRRLTSVYNNSIRIKRIASSIVNLKEFESEKLDLKFSETNIVAYVEVIYNLFIGYAKFSKVKLTFEKESDNLFAWIDSWQMERALYNIISLSVRKCKAGGEILISVKYDKDGVIINVCRNGVAPDDAKVRCSDDVALDLVSNIVENHGGRFTFDVESDSYQIYLVKGCSHINEESRIESDKQESYTPNVEDYSISNFDEDVVQNSEYFLSDQAKNLLIAVSDIKMKEMLVHSFSKLYNIHFVNSTNQALKQASAKMPDVVLATYSRGNVSAIDICEKFKRNELLSSIPIIVMASTIDEDDKLNSLKAGAVDYISKPFNLIHLKLKIENLLHVGDKGGDDVYSHLIVRDGFSAYDKSFLDKALGVIDAHVADFDFSVDVFASEMKMNRNVFYRKFKQIAQKTPNEMILEVRLKRASAMLLEHPEMTVSEIGFAVGFNSSTYFTQCFKHHFGVSPSKYCKQ